MVSAVSATTCGQAGCLPRAREQRLQRHENRQQKQKYCCPSLHVQSIASAEHWLLKERDAMAYNDEMPSPSAPPSPRAIQRTEQELLQALDADIDGTVVVTSTERAARALRKRYELWQQARGNQGWLSPKILAWDPWLGTFWNSAILGSAETRVLLSELQELELWHTVLAQDEAAVRTLSSGALAETAQRAWKQMHQYRIPLQPIRRDGSVDAVAFSRWATEFERLCKKHSFLSPALLEEALAQWISLRQIALPREGFLVGLDRVTPAQKLLIDALDAAGCRVHSVQLQPAEPATSACTIVVARTVEEEIESAARWVRELLFKHPAERIGVVVPALEQMRGTIAATFRRILSPGSMDIRARNPALPYEFSLGTPMHRLDPIRTALSLLRWLASALPAEEISWLLVHGDFAGAIDEAPEMPSSVDARAILDRDFRERKFQMGGPVSLNAFRGWLSQAKSREQAAALRRALDRFSIAADRQRLEKVRAFAEWQEVIEELLAAARWRPLAASNSADYQLERRWNILLNNLSSLGSVAEPVSFRAATQKLEHLAAQTLFSLETSGAPVQILGVPEAAGLVFDSVWWMNARISAWPPRGKALPFLPWNLQRESHMPYADPEEDSAFALRVTRRILDCASNAVVSFAIQESDAANASSHLPDRESVLSPLVREALPATPMIAAEDFVPQELSPASLAGNAPLEEVREEPFVPFQGTRVRGGVGFLKLHAACPFRAFAELRLGTRPLASSVTGLSSGTQGTLVHQVLEKFWQEYKSQKTLLATTAEQHRESLRAHLRKALDEFSHHAGELWQESLLEIESERIEQRLLQWLEQEKERPDFTVLTTEDEFEHRELGGIDFDCRIDRMDRVAQGVVLLDYKTGPVNRNSCEGERPDEPQLPAYAVLRGLESRGTKSPDTESPDTNALAGVAFAGLHPKNVGLTVIASLPSVFAKDSQSQTAMAGESAAGGGARSKFERSERSLTPLEMASQQDAWQSRLTQLAENFRAGNAEVDPKQGNTTCAYCRQMLLCRIREQQNGSGEFGEEVPGSSEQ